jgi:predicted metal-dependent HD superfamily phosphohydrolase
MIEEFLEFFERFRVDTNKSKNLFTQLTSKYSESERHYHTLEHISDMLSGLQSIKDQVTDFDCIYLATWFHDAQYHSAQSNNEEESADIAAVELQRLGLPSKLIKSTCELVLSTKWHLPYPNTEDCRYLLDLDLMILGQEEEKYTKYSQNIRREYDWVPEKEYRQKRGEILKKFLTRESIFYTQYFQEKFEQKARKNILSELATL